MNSITGLPAHPLLVHIPVALLPLTALGVAVLVARRAWYERYRWAVLVVGAIGTLGAILAASSGESLEAQLRANEGANAVRQVHDHAQAGDLARTLAIVFFVALAAYVTVPWLIERRSHTTGATSAPATPRWLHTVLTAVIAATTVASMVSIIDAGHSGAGQAWAEFDTSTPSASGHLPPDAPDPQQTSQATTTSSRPG